MTTSESHTEQRESIRRLSRDLVAASKTMSEQEARFLVDAYYLMQEDRKRAHNQVAAMEAEPHALVAWLAEQSRLLEGQIKRALDAYTDAQPAGVWMKSVFGIGPVLAAGLLAHIDIARAPTVGHIYSFAGIAGDGQKKWEKGQRRPFNASLRTLCWKIGQSFMKFSNQDDCFYGRLYRERKAKYVEANERGDYAETAARSLVERNFGKTTDAFGYLSAGRLPPAQIDARARRFAVKIFLSHLHTIMIWTTTQRLPPLPYALAQQGHAHFIPIPNAEVVGLTEAMLRSRDR